MQVFKVTHQLPDPIVLTPGVYVFAVGQDTLQGVVGFQFDYDNIQEEGFWIVSPIAGGGYPWAQANNRETLMIRPHLKISTNPTPVQELALDQDVKVFPSPFINKIHIISELPVLSLKLFDITGKLLAEEANSTYIKGLGLLPIGTYLLKVETERGAKVMEVVKS